MYEAWRIERAYPTDSTRSKWAWLTLTVSIRDARNAFAIAKALAAEGKVVRVCEVPDGQPDHAAIVRETFNADRMQP